MEITFMVKAILTAQAGYASIGIAVLGWVRDKSYVWLMRGLLVCIRASARCCIGARGLVECHVPT
jgi:hypothetical protein